MHINDSKTPFDSHRDRHENIGRGSIPISAFQWIMNNPDFQGIPLIMETPVQEREPPVDYKKSLQNDCICWKDGTAPYGVGRLFNLTPNCSFSLTAVWNCNAQSLSLKAGDNPEFYILSLVGGQSRILYTWGTLPGGRLCRCGSLVDVV
jgi:hypothetical protein